MNLHHHINNPDSSGDVPLKRKRGRPRKYPKIDGEEDAYIPNIRNTNRNQVSVEHVQIPPGFERVNGNQHSQSEVENSSGDGMVGQVVSGAVDAEFDAGYLISVKIGNSDATLSGIAFKPGRYVPVSAENDVAPGFPMIQRNVIPFRSGTHTQAQSCHLKEKRERVNINRNETHKVNGSLSVSQVPRAAVGSSNLTTSQGKNMPSVAEQTTDPLTRGNVVPIALPPDNSSNVVPVNNQQPQVMTQASQGSVSSVAKEIPSDGNQVPSSQIHPLTRGKAVPIVLSAGNSSNVAPVHQPPQVMTQVSLGSVSSITKEIPAHGNQVPSSQTHPLTRGNNVVPVVLPPCNSSNVMPVSNQPPQVMNQASLRSVFGFTKEIPADGNQMPSSQTQTSQNTLPRGVQNEDATHDQNSADAMKEAEAKSMILPDMPLEKLVIEVIKRVPVPSDSIDTETDNSKSGGEIPTKDFSSRPEDKVNEIDPPILFTGARQTNWSQGTFCINHGTFGDS